MRRLSLLLPLIFLIPMSVSAYTVSCSGIPDAGSCQQCFHFDLAGSNSPNDIFVPRTGLTSGQQEFIDLAQSPITGTVYQGASVSPTGTITGNFDRFESGPNASSSWVWAKSKSGQWVVRGNIPANIDHSKPVYAIKYTTLSYIKENGVMVNGSEVPHLECGFFYIPFQAVCGNGKTEWSEQCDDGNTNNLDNCSNACISAQCGNGVREWSEQCDDGNLVNSDSCNNACISFIPQTPECRVQAFDTFGPAPLTTTLSCTGTPRGRSVILITRNNTLVDSSETSSKTFTFNESGRYTVRCYPDASNNQSNTCSTVVTVDGQCGNGVVEKGEMCDDGNTISGDSCDRACRLSSCGNGVREYGEQCDDGNNRNNDTCTNICQNVSADSGPSNILFIGTILSVFGAYGIFVYRKKMPWLKR